MTRIRQRVCRQQSNYTCQSRGNNRTLFSVPEKCGRISDGQQFNSFFSAHPTVTIKVQQTQRYSDDSSSRRYVADRVNGIGTLIKVIVAASVALGHSSVQIALMSVKLLSNISSIRAPARDVCAKIARKKVSAKNVRTSFFQKCFHCSHNVKNEQRKAVKPVPSNLNPQQRPHL